VPAALLERAADVVGAGAMRRDWTAWDALRPHPTLAERFGAHLVAFIDGSGAPEGGPMAWAR